MPMTQSKGPAQPARPGVSRFREVGKKVLALGISLGISFLILEVYARATWSSPLHIPREAVRTPGIFSFRLKVDNDTWFDRADGGKFHMITNARGFRGPLVSSMADKPLKVLSLGDSFTLGWGVDLEQHSMARFVTDYRHAHPDRDVGHTYVSCGGWDPKDYYFGYMTEARETKPDVVVLGVFSGNDVMPASAPRILDPSQAPFVDTLPESDQPFFRSFDWVRAQLSGSLLVAKLRAKHSKPAAYALFDPDMDKQKKDWDTTFFYIKAIDDAVRKDGGHLVVLLYPSMLQVNTPTALDDAGYDHAMPERVVGAFCQENHIDLIRPLEALIAKNRHNDAYFLKDRHLTERGNEIVAEVLTEQLSPVLDHIWAEKTHAAATP
jgi:hypothetical protein